MKSCAMFALLVTTTVALGGCTGDLSTDDVDDEVAPTKVAVVDQGSLPQSTIIIKPKKVAKFKPGNN